MTNTRDYTGMKNATAVKAQTRIDIMEVIVKALVAEFGDDAVKKVGTNEYAVVVGTANDSDGYPNDVVATVKPTVKEWETRKTTKKTFEKYDIDAEAEAYEMTLKDKAEAKAEKERLKNEKIARDKKAREEKKEKEEEKREEEKEEKKEEEKKEN